MESPQKHVVDQHIKINSRKLAGVQRPLGLFTDIPHTCSRTCIWDTKVLHGQTLMSTASPLEKRCWEVFFLASLSSSPCATLLSRPPLGTEHRTVGCIMYVFARGPLDFSGSPRLSSRSLIFTLSTFRHSRAEWACSAPVGPRRKGALGTSAGHRFLDDMWADMFWAIATTETVGDGTVEPM